MQLTSMHTFNYSGRINKISTADLTRYMTIYTNYLYFNFRLGFHSEVYVKSREEEKNQRKRKYTCTRFYETFFDLLKSHCMRLTLESIVHKHTHRQLTTLIAIQIENLPIREKYPLNG